MTTNSLTDRLGLATVPQILGPLVDAAQILELGDGMAAYIIENPGQSLTISAHRAIYDALVPMTSESFGADQTTYWRQRSKEGYLERLSEFVMMADGEGRFVGWTGFHVLRWDDHTLIYLDSTGMVPTLQSRGAMRRLMSIRVPAAVAKHGKTDRPVYLAARSESPVFYRLMRRLVDDENIFPHPTLALPPRISQAGADLAQWLGQSALFDPATLTLSGAYEDLDELYGELPTTGDPALDTLFRDRLGPLDAYLIIAQAH